MRLNKIISHNTRYSRREADELIKKGLVKIDGKVVTDLATKASFEDKVSVDGKTLYEKSGYTVLVYNKPKGELVSKKDDRGRRTIYDSLPQKYSHYLSVGRLDYASEGLLLLCDSPSVVSALMHGDLERVYYVKINGEITPAMEEAMRLGLHAEDARRGGHSDSSIHAMDFAPFVDYRIIKSRPNFSTVKVTIREGKNRELRRFFGYFDTEVVDLKRVSYGIVDLGMLKPGKTRFLETNEYKALRDYISYTEEISD
ncbi:pseudouridine synthase [Sulfurospirillum arcachonense]|uniref:pseudouridine synthase n=1 Tax=Sulfurospirillum arcachonense TaxID=57666 RepID=UPI00046A60D4|nr:pseudouridine synthase [Sulfurospirillum arcachonense]